MSKTKPENTAASEPKPKTPRRRKTPAPAQPPEIATVLQAAHDKKADQVLATVHPHPTGAGPSSTDTETVADEDQGEGA